MNLNQAMAKYNFLGGHEKAQFFLDNLATFKTSKKFERLLVETWQTAETGQCPPFGLQDGRFPWIEAFLLADSQKLIAAGEKLPSPNEEGKYVAYRGLPFGKELNVIGCSWTLSKERAIWFATRNVRYFAGTGEVGFLPPTEPTLYRCEFKPEEIAFFSDSRNEAEIVIEPRRLPSIRSKRLTVERLSA